MGLIEQAKARVARFVRWWVLVEDEEDDPDGFAMELDKIFAPLAEHIAALEAALAKYEKEKTNGVN